MPRWRHPRAPAARPGKAGWAESFVSEVVPAPCPRLCPQGRPTDDVVASIHEMLRSFRSKLEAGEARLRARAPPHPFHPHL